MDKKSDTPDAKVRESDRGIYRIVSDRGSALGLFVARNKGDALACYSKKTHKSLRGSVVQTKPGDADHDEFRMRLLLASDSEVDAGFELNRDDS